MIGSPARQGFGTSWRAFQSETETGLSRRPGLPGFPFSVSSLHSLRVHESAAIDVFRFELIVRPATQSDVVDRGFTAFGVRLDVVVFEKFSLAAAMA